MGPRTARLVVSLLITALLGTASVSGAAPRYPFTEKGARVTISAVLRDGVALDDGTGKKVIKRFKAITAVKDEGRNAKTVTYTFTVAEAGAPDQVAEREGRASFERRASTRGMKWYLIADDGEPIPID